MGLHIINNIFLSPSSSSSSSSCSSIWSGKHSLQTKRDNCYSTRDKYATRFQLVQADYKFPPDPANCFGNRSSTSRHSLQLSDGNQDQWKPRKEKRKSSTYTWSSTLRLSHSLTDIPFEYSPLAHCRQIWRHQIKQEHSKSWLRTPSSGVNNNNNKNFKDQFTKSGSMIHSQLTETNHKKPYSIRYALQMLPASSICTSPLPLIANLIQSVRGVPQYSPTDASKPMLFHVQRLVA